MLQDIEMRGPLLNAADCVAPEPGALESVGEYTSSLNNLVRVRVEHIGWFEYIRVVGLLVALVCPITLVVYVIYDSWQNNPSNRSWLILGLGFYIGAALKAIYETVIRLIDRLCFLRVEIRRLSSSILFEAITSALEKEAELSGGTCSRDTEAFQEHDPITGQFSVRLNFWSTRPRSLRVCVLVQYVANYGNFLWVLLLVCGM